MAGSSAIIPDASGGIHGFLRDASGTFTTIDVPGAIVTSIKAINGRGQMVGEYIDAAGRGHGFLLEQRRLHDH